MERDVVIVGAGPTGSAAAIALNNKGHDVLLIDRKEFPRDKTCGDGIPANAVEILFSLGMEERFQDSNFYPVDRILLSSPRGYIVEADLAPGVRFGADSYVVPRMKFDALIQDFAVESGVEFLHAQVKDVIIEDGQVRGVRTRVNGSDVDIGARVVIGADGVTSTIARAIRPDKHEDGHRAVALRCYVKGMEELPHQVEFYLYKGILPGYAWIFPLGPGEANVGLGMRLDHFREIGKSLEDMLDIFLEMPSLGKRFDNGTEINDVAVWQLNFGSQNMQRAYPGALLIGDAAGLINPLTGGGIHNGLQSSLLAADVVDKALKNDDVSLEQLQEYDSGIHAKLEQSMKKSYNIQRSLLRFPLWVDLVVKLGGSNSTIAQTFISKL